MTRQDALDALSDIQKLMPGIQSIVVTDRDGVEVLSVPENVLSTTEARQNSQILSTIFSLTHEQSQKLDGFGVTKYLISDFGPDVLLQANASPLVITIRGCRESLSDSDLLGILDRTKAIFTQVMTELTSVVV